MKRAKVIVNAKVNIGVNGAVMAHPIGAAIPFPTPYLSAYTKGPLFPSSIPLPLGIG